MLQCREPSIYLLLARTHRVQHVTRRQQHIKTNAHKAAFPSSTGAVLIGLLRRLCGA